MLVEIDVVLLLRSGIAFSYDINCSSADSGLASTEAAAAAAGQFPHPAKETHAKTTNVRW